ncbi:MAG: hypothetical protein QME60_05890 [Verrucomicrobiota bacterium]|nr:hypothetical protein [Verrucomicrobiota bacterium]
MNKAFWSRFSKAEAIRCVEVKDRVQARIARETRGFSPDRLIEYLREASRQFQAESNAMYHPDATRPMVVRETNERGAER